MQHYGGQPMEINPNGVTKADIIVGIASYNEADLIRFPTQQASIGLREYFKDKRSVIINCDNNSPDGTRDVFLNTETEVPKIYISTPPGVKGKGSNFRNLFAKVVELGARAVVVIDADLKSITPRWIHNLGEPLFSEYGYVAPIYVRHKYDGTITNNIAYPLTRCLYGRRVRQPIAGDFGFSGELAKQFLKPDLWNENVEHFGIDIWMTTIAMNRGIPICQSFVGGPKVHKPKDPSADLGPMFSQVIGTIFFLMENFETLWTRVKWSKPTAIYGFGLGITEEPPPVSVNEVRLYEKCFNQKEAFEETWRTVMSPEVYGKFSEVLQLSKDRFEFPSALWAQILFDFAVTYHQGAVEKSMLLAALIPLYYGRTLSFVRATKNMDTRQAEEYVEDQCRVFEETKGYLIERWVAINPARKAEGYG